MGVFPPVHEYVNDRVADGARRGGGPGVESVGPHGPAASKGTVHGAGDADREPCDAARQARSVFGLDQEVKMVVLGGELDDPEPLVGGGGERAADGREDPVGTEAANGGRGAQRDVDRMRGLVRRPRTMGHTGTPARCGFAAGAPAAATPGARVRERELRGPSTHGGS